MNTFTRLYRLDDERQGQDVTKGKLRHLDRALEPGPNIECPGSRIHLGMIGDEGALDPHQNETRTAWSVSFRRAACGHCPLVHGRRLGSSPDVDSRVTPNGTYAGDPSAFRRHCYGRLAQNPNADSGCADIPRHSQSLRSPANVMCAGEAHPATLLLANFMRPARRWR